MRLAFAPYLLDFKRPARTSRGVYEQKPTYLIKVFDENDPSRFGIGEAAVFPDLSPEADWRYEYKLVELLANVAIGKKTDLSGFSSIQYGFEQALLNFSSGCGDLYFPSRFTEGKDPITINGLIWMNPIDDMLLQIEKKVLQGFKCIKMKIGAIDWESEQKMIKMARERFSFRQLELRVDANGAFNENNVMSRLEWLAEMGIHSIEQPVKAGNFSLMKEVCRLSPVPVALDEELIGIYEPAAKDEMLDTLNPAFIILKPALCGGFSGAADWIDRAGKRGIGWWVTSSLESNIGLNALAQWTATLNNQMAQGLGTGALFTNNFETPVFLEEEMLSFDPSVHIDRNALDNLNWRQ